VSVFTSFESRYLKRLGERINEDIRRGEEMLGSGSKITGDAAATGMACTRIVGEIAGLKLALKHMQEIHKDMTGPAAHKKEARD